MTRSKSGVIRIQNIYHQKKSSRTMTVTLENPTILPDKSSQIETNIRDKQRNFDNFSNRQTANDVIWPQNGQAPVVQNFIDFRPIFDRFFGQQEGAVETPQLTPQLKSSEDKFLVVKLQEENTKLNHKLTKIAETKSELIAKNQELSAKLHVLSHYIKTRLSAGDEAELFEKLYD